MGRVRKRISRKKKDDHGQLLMDNTCRHGPGKRSGRSPLRNGQKFRRRTGIK
jgi:hypothetical protein